MGVKLHICSSDEASLALMLSGQILQETMFNKIETFPEEDQIAMVKHVKDQSFAIMEAVNKMFSELPLVPQVNNDKDMGNFKCAVAAHLATNMFLSIANLYCEIGGGANGSSGNGTD